MRDDQSEPCAQSKQKRIMTQHLGVSAQVKEKLHQQTRAKHNSACKQNRSSLHAMRTGERTEAQRV